MEPNDNKTWCRLREGQEIDGKLSKAHRDECPPLEFSWHGFCRSCPWGTEPNFDKDACTPPNDEETVLLRENERNLNCEWNEVYHNGYCSPCLFGEVPNKDKTQCEPPSNGLRAILDANKGRCPVTEKFFLGNCRSCGVSDVANK